MTSYQNTRQSLIDGVPELERIQALPPRALSILIPCFACDAAAGWSCGVHDHRFDSFDKLRIDLVLGREPTFAQRFKLENADGPPDCAYRTEVVRFALAANLEVWRAILASQTHPDGLLSMVRAEPLFRLAAGVETLRSGRGPRRRADDTVEIRLAELPAERAR